MGCQWRCRCFRVSPLLRPGVWSGGAVVGGINCQLMWQVAETDSQGSKQPCGTFPRLHTNTYYLHIHVSLFALGKKKKTQPKTTKDWQRMSMSAELRMPRTSQWPSCLCVSVCFTSIDPSCCLCWNRTEISSNNLDTLNITPLSDQSLCS